MKLLRLSSALLAAGLFAAVPSPGVAAPADISDVPSLVSWRLDPAHPCVRDEVALVVRGFHATPCDSFLGAEAIGPGRVRVRTQVHDLRLCIVGPTQFFDVPISLGRFPVGPNAIEILSEIVHVGRDGGPDTARFRSTFNFEVAATCDAPPHPDLPYVDAVRIGPKILCGLGEAICPNDSILVAVEGTFPDNCHFLRRVELVPSDIVGPGPEPPILRLLMDDGGCLGRPCSVGPFPWYATATLPPLPTRRYGLIVQLGQVTCADTFPPVFDSAAVPFAVASAESCRRVLRLCLDGRWDHAGRLGECDAGVSDDHAAQVTFRVRSAVALSGLQGALVLDHPGLRVTGLETVGAAAGMHLVWNPTFKGARFWLFAESGAPILPAPGGSSGVAVLRVTLEGPDPRSASPAIPIPPVSRLFAEELLGSDIEGQGIRECLPPPCVDLRFFFRDAAVICTERACDFNGDGDTDVRDLVLMVHCVNGEGPCPESAAQRFDCDGDGQFALPDVICCALHLLRDDRCPDCTVDSIRVEPRMRLTLGTARPTGAGIDLPVRLEAADRLGAARLALDYPSERFDVSGVAVGGTPTDWLELDQVVDGRVTIGLIRTRSAGSDTPEALDLVVHLTLKPGEAAGGEARVVEGDFSGPDGVMLEFRLDGAPQHLGPGFRLALSENRPDPFSGHTRFDLTLDAAADVEVGVYDVTGRRVALLHRGPLSAGRHPLGWDGRAEGGAAAPNGIYFYRANSSDRSVSRRMTLLRAD